MLGGLYSSTVTTVVLAKRARQEHSSHIYAGSILMAAGVMYLRLLVLVGLFSFSIMERLAVPFVLLACVGLLEGWLWSRLRDADSRGGETSFEVKNPLELSAAFLFALLFVALLAVTHYAILYFGSGGVYGLAALTGTTDPTPFILGITQSAGKTTPRGLATGAIIVAAASNNLVKGLYAYGFADRDTGTQALGLLVALAALGLLPLAF